MSDERPPGVLGGLPRTRPHRRSAKRPAAQPRADAKPTADEKPGARGKPATRGKPKPRATPSDAATAKPAQPRPPEPIPSDSATPLGTAVQATAELAEIGLGAGVRALRRALSRLPRP